MSTSGKRVSAVAVFAVMAVALLWGAIAHGDVNPPIFLTRLGNVIKTYPYTAQLLVGGAFTQGGSTYATSTTGTVLQLGANTFDEETSIDAVCYTSSCTLSFPATSTLASNFLPLSGQKRTIWIRNAGTSSSIAINITGGTGFLLKKAATSTGATIYGDTDAGNFGRIELIRKPTTDIEMLLTTFTD